MERRQFLKASGAVIGGSALANPASASVFHVRDSEVVTSKETLVRKANWWIPGVPTRWEWEIDVRVDRPGKYEFTAYGDGNRLSSVRRTIRKSDEFTMKMWGKKMDKLFIERVAPYSE